MSTVLGDVANCRCIRRIKLSIRGVPVFESRIGLWHRVGLWRNLETVCYYIYVFVTSIYGVA